VIKRQQYSPFCGRYPLIVSNESLTCFGPAGLVEFQVVQ